MLSQGVPMLLGGDEIGRTQRGNNNAYAQDNEISWFDWEHADADLLAFTQGLDRPPSRASGVPSTALVPGPPDPRRIGHRHRLAGARRIADVGQAMD